MRPCDLTIARARPELVEGSLRLFPTAGAEGGPSNSLTHIRTKGVCCPWSPPRESELVLEVPVLALLAALRVLGSVGGVLVEVDLHLCGVEVVGGRLARWRRWGVSPITILRRLELFTVTAVIPITSRRWPEAAGGDHLEHGRLGVAGLPPEPPQMTVEDSHVRALPESAAVVM